MALHRDIYWVGRQWAVTGYGLQACDQRQKSKFDIEASRLWEDGLLESMRAHPWLNIEDFEKALAVARQRFPEPPRTTAPPPPAPIGSPVRDGHAATPQRQALKPEIRIQKAAPVDPPPGISRAEQPGLLRSETAAAPKPAPGFAMRYAASAKFARPWRVRLRR
jgi:hypothetical protein